MRKTRTKAGHMGINAGKSNAKYYSYSNAQGASIQRASTRNENAQSGFSQKANRGEPDTLTPSPVQPTSDSTSTRQPSTRRMSPEADPIILDAVPVEDERSANPNSKEPSAAQKAKGAAQIAAGGALAAVGAPMLILPGPGAVAILGGAALASKGQRNYSGREATPLEEKMDDAAAKAAVAAGEAAKKSAHKLADRVAEEAPKAVGKTMAAAEALKQHLERRK